MKHYPPQEAIQLLAFCPLCKQRNAQVRGRIIGGSQDTHVLYLRCQHGKHALLTMVQTTGECIRSIGLVTDLGLNDILRIKSQSSISLDDVLRTHVSVGQKGFLNGFLQERLEE